MASHLLCLINDLLNWREDAHVVLADYLEECGFERQFHGHGGLYSCVRFVLALLNIGAIELELVDQLEMPDDEKRDVHRLFGESPNT